MAAICGTMAERHVLLGLPLQRQRTDIDRSTLAELHRGNRLSACEALAHELSARLAWSERGIGLSHSDLPVQSVVMIPLSRHHDRLLIHYHLP